MTPQVLDIFQSLFAVLVLASLVGGWLGHRRPSRTIENLNARIYSWWVMILVGGFAISLGQYGLVLFFLLLSWFALQEFCGSAPLRRPGSWHFVMVPAQYLAIACGWHWVALLLIPLVGFAFGKQRWLGLLLCVYGLSFIPALGQAEWMLYLVLVVQASDVLQYLWGKMIGRHPVSARISPSKTIEGLVGGVVSASLLGMWLQLLTPFGSKGALLVALVITSAGFCSGLLLSAIKRQREIKDWGTAIAGHGGVLDRVDSLCLSAPLFYLILKAFT